MEKSKYSLSLWAWALNEEFLVEPFVRESVEHLQRVTDDFEIILADDGSVDHTWSIMQKLAREFPQLKIARHGKNRRPGFCMHTCLEMTTKEIVFWNTVDSFFDITTLPEWIEELDHCDMIQGIRSDLKANTPYRKLTHLVNYYLIRLLFAINLREFQNIKFCRAKFLKEVGLESSSTFTNPECDIKAFWAGKTVKEKSMVFLSRRAGKAKGANPWGILETLRDIFYYWIKWKILKRFPFEARQGTIIKINGTRWPR